MGLSLFDLYLAFACLSFYTGMALYLGGDSLAVGLMAEVHLDFYWFSFWTTWCCDTSDQMCKIMVDKTHVSGLPKDTVFGTPVLGAYITRLSKILSITILER